MVKIREFKIVGNGGDVDITDIKVLYTPTMKTLTYKGSAESMSSPHKYALTIQVLGVKQDEVKYINDIPCISEDVLATKDIKVDCKCKQYVMGGCLKGNMSHGCAVYTNKELTSYKRTTDNPNLTKNPDKEPQLCKHLASFMRTIIDNYTLK